MSEFFRVGAPPAFAGKTLRELAGLVHDAEDQGDDVLLVQCWDELKRRNGHYAGMMNVFMEFYREVWKERMEAKKP